MNLKRLALLFLILAPLKAQTTLNLSHDLVSLGIANQNMVPNQPELDSQPLLTAALEYAQNNSGVQTLIADRGAYYFLTMAGPVQYIFLGNVSNLTVDFQGSNLYFQDGTWRAFEVDYCQGVTLRNFTIDQIVPRYTQVTLTSIDPVNGVLGYSVPAGWTDPATFTSTALGTPRLFAVFFRNGLRCPPRQSLLSAILLPLRTWW